MIAVASQPLTSSLPLSLYFQTWRTVRRMSSIPNATLHSVAFFVFAHSSSSASVLQDAALSLIARKSASLRWPSGIHPGVARTALAVLALGEVRLVLLPPSSRLTLQTISASCAAVMIGRFSKGI